jgi:hypothetical protein
VELNGQTLALDMERRVYYSNARLAEPSVARSAQDGEQVRFIPGSNNTAIMVAVRPSNT